jgi:2-(1,2-epoxy-1,2-dihydrophenyl)acetyl-CoA isomerase
MRITTDDGVRRVTFDRPDARNAMTLETARELADALEADDPEALSAIVLTGEGDAFCAGGDIEAIAEREETTEDAHHRLEDTFGRIVENAMTSRVPIVAKVNGDAVGAGLSVAAVSDVAIAAESARFSSAFVRVGLVPDSGGSFLLPRLVGLQQAKRLAFTGAFVDAGEAADLGLVAEAVPDHELDECVEDLVETLRRRPTRTIALTKEAIHDNLGRPWRDAMDREHAAQLRAYGTSEHEEGVAAFLEDRRPRYDS